MRKERSNSDWVEDYLDDVLSSKEKEDFELRLKEDNSLKEELTLSEKIRSELSKGSSLRNKILTVEEELNSEGLFRGNEIQMVAKKNNWVIGIAASLLIAVGAFWFMNGSDQLQESKVDIIFAEYSKTWDEHLMNQKVELESLGFADDKAGYKDSLNMALDYIEEGSYDTARKLLYTLIERNPEDPKANYYYGYNQLNLGNYGIALKSFSKLINSDDESIKYDAHFYYAMVIMKIDGEESALVEFEKIATDDKSPNRDMARDYITMLKN